METLSPHSPTKLPESPVAAQRTPDAGVSPSRHLGNNNDDAARRFLSQKARETSDFSALRGTKYVALETIGTGAYGVVCAAIDRKTKEKVAVKKIGDADAFVVAKRTFREIKILRHLKHDNVIGVRDLFLGGDEEEGGGGGGFRDIYVVLDFMESDLHHIIHSQQVLSEEHFRFFVYQIFRALKFIHSAHVIHRDLKPSNILVNENCELKIGDFGMARGLVPLSNASSDSSTFLTMYVSTRWYRAPELMLCITDYASGVDVWSVGCIFAEMLWRRQLFPGRDYMHQVKMIVALLGSPSPELLERCQSSQIRDFLRGLGQHLGKPLRDLFPHVSEEGLDLLTKTLVLDPKNRLSAEEALKHPFLTKYHNEALEIRCPRLFDFSFEKNDPTKEFLRKAIKEEVDRLKAEKSHRLSRRFTRTGALIKPAKTFDELQKENEMKSETEKPKEEKDLNLLVRNLGVEDVHMASAKSLGSASSFKMETDASTASNVQAGEATDKKEIKDPNLVPNEVHPTSSIAPSKVSDSTPPSSDVSASAIPIPLSANPPQPLDPDAFVKPPKISDEDPKTNQRKPFVSNDTKALLKAKLLSGAISGRPKIEDAAASGKMTASLRFREREEKRKKKKEKAMERKKRLEKEKAGKRTLSEQDLNMLQRWALMCPKTDGAGADNGVEAASESLPQPASNFTEYRETLSDSNSPENYLTSHGDRESEGNSTTFSEIVGTTGRKETEISETQSDPFSYLTISSSIGIPSPERRVTVSKDATAGTMAATSLPAASLHAGPSVIPGPKFGRLDVFSMRDEAGISAVGSTFAPSITDDAAKSAANHRLSDRDPFMSSIADEGLETLRVAGDAEETSVESLTRLLSRSAKLEEDPAAPTLPLPLALSPKGSGAAYGIDGVTLDSFPFVDVAGGARISPFPSSEVPTTPMLLDAWLDLRQELEARQGSNNNNHGNVEISFLEHELKCLNRRGKDK